MIPSAKVFLRLISAAASSVEFTQYTQNLRDIFYSDFGAVGDGASDDYAAINSAHEYANKYGHTVVAKKNAFYRIDSIPKQIDVTSSVNWNNATFIIGDGECSFPLFCVGSDNNENTDLNYEVEKTVLKDANFLLSSCITCISISGSNTEVSGITVNFSLDNTESACNEKAYLTVSNANNVTISDYRFSTPNTFAPSISHYALRVDNSQGFTLLRCNQNDFFTLDGYTPATENKAIISFENMHLASIDGCIASVIVIESNVTESLIKNSVFYEAYLENPADISTENLYVYNSNQ